MPPMHQMLLPLETAPRYTFETLVRHEGIDAAASMILAVYAHGELPLPFLFLHGPAGTGKTHLLRSTVALLSDRFTGEARSVRVCTALGDPVGSGSLGEIVAEITAYEGPIRGVAVDDLHLLSEQDAPLLWSLSNTLTRLGAPLLMASRLAPDASFGGDPHLVSRLSAGLVFAPALPDDTARMRILDKMARDRNLRIPPEVIAYLVRHKPRNVKELAVILDKLDRASLELQRRITLPLVKLVEKTGLL
jgi:chromosomal replication initiation ATPase DnaA